MAQKKGQQRSQRGTSQRSRSQSGSQSQSSERRRQPAAAEEMTETEDFEEE